MYNKVKEIINPVYLVGGCVRDELLGIKPKDYDFITPLSPDEIEAKVREAKRRPYLIGKRFGTIGFKLDGQMIEVTTFRTEKYEKNNRKPNVEFVNDIHEDLSRRDFTINAIAKRGTKYIDPFDGAKDLKDKVLRCVGSAKARFREDPLRMLRAARFYAQLNLLEVDEDIWKKALELNYKILSISKERWMLELDKILLTDEVNKGLDFLMSTELFNYMIPELSLQYNYNQNSNYHDYDLWTHTCRTVFNTPKDLNLRWASLLHDIAKPFVVTEKNGRSHYAKHDLLGAAIVEKTANYLKWSNDRRKIVVDLVLNHLRDDSPLKECDNQSKLRSQK